MENHIDLLKKEAKAMFKDFYLKKIAAYLLAKAVINVKK